MIGTSGCADILTVLALATGHVLRPEALLARLVFGNAVLWVIALLSAGIIVSLIGYVLRIV